jgi:hypothetical protein
MPEYTPNRTIQGEHNGKALLRREEVLEIRRLSATGVSGRALARQFDLSNEAVYHILSGRNWGWLREDEHDEPPDTLTGVVDGGPPTGGDAAAHSD